MAENGGKGQTTPFTGIDAGRNYRAMYADLYKFHERNNPPDTVNEADYWNKACKELLELAEKHGADAFMNSLLLAVYAELEREFYKLKGQNGDAGKCNIGSA